MNENNDKHPLFVSSVSKAFEVLELFSNEVASLSLTEIHQSSSLGMSAVQRYLYTLETLGYLEKDLETKRYRLTLKSLFSASGYLSNNELIRIAAPHIMQLRLQNNLRIGLSVLWKDRVVYVMALQGTREAFQTDYPGFHVPIYCTTSGRMFMTSKQDEKIREYLKNDSKVERTNTTKTNMEEILSCIHVAKQQGYCMTDQEYRRGYLNLCVPVTQDMNSIRACIVAVGQNTEWDLPKLEAKILPKLQEAARVISGGI